MLLDRWLKLPFEPFITILLCVSALIARFVPKPVDIGLGPLPLVNNIYHKKVFERAGYSAETFANQVWHITNAFDVRSDLHPLNQFGKLGIWTNSIRFVIWTLFRYKCIVIYFDGATLGVSNTFFLWKLEPFFLALAGIKTIVMPYGGDVQVMSRSPNLQFKDAMSKDYPKHRFEHGRIAGKVELWTKYGSHIIGGCEWVDYMHHWDTLMISHFSIDTQDWSDAYVNDVPVRTDGKFRVLHAPNHRNIKGTQHVIDAVRELQEEGHPFELVLVEKRPNHEVREMIKSVDVVVDQLIIGWYAMFAIESMALAKPVICHLRKDLEDLYRCAGLYERDEKIPMIDATPLSIKETLLRLYNERETLPDIGRNGREYVMRHHSIAAIEKILGKIANDLIGPPRQERIGA